MPRPARPYAPAWAPALHAPVGGNRVAGWHPPATRPSDPEQGRRRVMITLPEPLSNLRDELGQRGLKVSQGLITVPTLRVESLSVGYHYHDAERATGWCVAHPDAGCELVATEGAAPTAVAALLQRRIWGRE